MTLALYPGSFDPLTFGHLNVIRRGLALFDNLIVAVAHNVRKRALFSVEERVAMIKQVVGQDPNVDVAHFDGLLVDYAQKRQANCILRGLRALSDFEFEFQLAHLNRRLGRGLETMFMMTGEEHFYVNSHMVREIAAFGGDVDGLVPPYVAHCLKKKFIRAATQDGPR